MPGRPPLPSTVVATSHSSTTSSDPPTARPISRVARLPAADRAHERDQEQRGPAEEYQPSEQLGLAGLAQEMRSLANPGTGSEVGQANEVDLEATLDERQLRERHHERGDQGKDREDENDDECRPQEQVPRDAWIVPVAARGRSYARGRKRVRSREDRTLLV